MKKITPHPILFLLLTGIMCLLTACKKENEDIYYKTIGVGYVYDTTHNKPIRDITITILYYSNYSTWFPISSRSETVTTNSLGCYKVRFMEKLWSENENKYSEIRLCRIYVSGYSENYSNWRIDYPYIEYPSGSGINIYPSHYNLHEEGKLSLDTIKFYKIN